jgi:hypothetical protein
MTQYRMLVDKVTFHSSDSQYTNVYQHPVLGHVRSPFIPLTLFTLTLFGNTLMSTNILYWVRMLVDISVLPNKVKVKRVRGIKGDLTVLGHVRSPFIPLTLFTLTLFGNTLMSTNILYWAMSGHFLFL